MSLNGLLHDAAKELSIAFEQYDMEQRVAQLVDIAVV
jgi:hypothetical protein